MILHFMILLFLTDSIFGLKDPKILSSSNVSSNTLPCPVPDDIFPCECVVDEDLNMDMLCFDIYDSEELKRIFNQEIPIKKFRSLIIENSKNLQELCSDCLGDASFQNIQITGCSIHTVESGALAPSASRVISLNLKFNAINNFPFEEIANFSELLLLDLSNNSLENIPAPQSESLLYLSLDGNVLGSLHADWFAGVPNLISLDLVECSISFIEQRTYQQMGNLSVLDLHGNQVTELREFSIQLHGEDSALFLQSNSISEVSVGAIRGVTGIIRLDDNKLETLEEDIWKATMQGVQYFYVNDNPLKCECDIAWIILNRDYMDKLQGNETCYDGERLVDLDPKIYETLC